MITKEEAEKKQVKQRINAIHEVFDGLIEWWFIVTGKQIGRAHV